MEIDGQATKVLDAAFKMDVVRDVVPLLHCCHEDFIAALDL